MNRDADNVMYVIVSNKIVLFSYIVQVYYCRFSSWHFFPKWPHLQGSLPTF